jgi:hypothetical protein
LSWLQFLTSQAKFKVDKTACLVLKSAEHTD